MFKATELFKRVYKLLDSAIEITVLSEDGTDKTLFAAFPSDTQRNELYDKVINKIPESCKTELTSIDEYTKRWITGNISNYEYLHVVNLHASRSRMDLSQYPVFPWVL